MFNLSYLLAERTNTIDYVAVVLFLENRLLNLSKGPLNTLRGQMQVQSRILIETQNIDRGTPKVFLHPPSPSERMSFIKIIGLIIPRVTALSIQKRDCEKYLLKTAA
jgi:hypothetical protein